MTQFNKNLYADTNFVTHVVVDWERGEWQFSDGPPEARSTSVDYKNLNEGLRDFQGRKLVFYFDEGAKTEPKLDYLTIRGCVEIDGEVESFATSYDGETNPDAVADTMLSRSSGALGCDARSVKTYWTLYAHMTDGTEEAIGDFSTFEHAHRMQQLLLAPMREAANLLEDAPSSTWSDEATSAHDMLEDICNQSSTEERL